MSDPPPVIRQAHPAERAALVAIQLRASLIWAEYRADLEANPDAIVLLPDSIEEGRVRVAIVDGEPAGFAEWSVTSDEEWELEGLFVEPAWMRHGIGALLVRDVVRLAREGGARSLAVVGNPNALVFYERAGFVQEGSVPTRFGPGIRMRLTLLALAAAVALSLAACGGSGKPKCTVVPESIPTAQLAAAGASLRVAAGATVYAVLVEPEQYAGPAYPPGFPWVAPTSSDRKVLSRLTLCPSHGESTPALSIAGFRAARTGSATLRAPLAAPWRSFPGRPPDYGASVSVSG
jgi:GNAT superfamily N-acetyltransferase